MRSFVVVISYIIISIVPSLYAQETDHLGFLDPDEYRNPFVMGKQWEKLHPAVCDQILGILKKSQGKYAAMDCSFSMSGEEKDGRWLFHWYISLDFPGGYRYRLDRPQWIEGAVRSEWRTHGQGTYDPAWAIPQGKYAFKYIDKLRDHLGYFEPDEWTVSLNQYWYNRRIPQSLWYIGKKTLENDFVWKMLPGGKQQMKEREAWKKWQERYRLERDRER